MDGIFAALQLNGALQRALDLLDDRIVARGEQTVRAAMQQQLHAPPLQFHAQRGFAPPAGPEAALNQTMRPRTLQHTLNHAPAAHQVAALEEELRKRPHVDPKARLFHAEPLPPLRNTEIIDKPHFLGTI